MKEIFNVAKKEIIFIGALFLLTSLILKIAFYNEGLLALLRIAASIFWIFIIPGYSIMLYWHDKFGFIERAIVGTIAAAALTGILSYYLGIIGLNIKYHTLLLPLLIVLLGFIAAIKKRPIHTSP